MSATALLLNDAIDRVLAAPVASHCWLNLAAQVRQIDSDELLLQVRDLISTRIADSGLEGFFRATFLDIVSGDFRHLARAAELLARLQPPDQDRMTAFFHFAWQRALLYSHQRSEFVQHLQTIELPRLAPLLGYPVVPAGTTASLNAAPLQRVAFIGPDLISPRHPPSRMLLEQAEILQQAGVTVGLYACQESMVPDSQHLLGQGASLPMREPAMAPWIQQAPAGTALVIASHELSMQRRWHIMLSHIRAFQPDLVFFVGMHSGLIRALYPAYPVLALATNSLAPMVMSDVWLTAQSELDGNIDDYWQAGQPPAQAYYHPFRARRQPCGTPVSKAELGIPEQALLLISVGNQLAEQISPEWAERMQACLTRHPQLHWLLLGGAGTYPASLAPHPRIHVRAHSERAIEHIAGSDIFLHPPIMGGGLSVCEAMSLGLPVLALRGSDGGDKLGPTAMADADQYFAQLEMWLQQPAVRRAAGAAMAERFSTSIDLQASAPSLLAACELTRQRYARRSAQA